MSDLISREWLKVVVDNAPWDTEHDANYAHHIAYELAPAAQPETGMLERNTIRVGIKVDDEELKKVLAEIRNAERQLQPERKTGRWIVPIPKGKTVSYGRSYWECDQCHTAVCFGNEMKFCPNCGAMMEEKHDRN